MPATSFVLIDLDRERGQGEAMDLNHGLAFSASSMKIYAGEYTDCANADIVVICAGVARRSRGNPGWIFLQRNAAVFRSIIGPVTESGFNGIFLVATNPVDIMTRITCTLSGFNPVGCWARRHAGHRPAAVPARGVFLGRSPQYARLCDWGAWGQRIRPLVSGNDGDQADSHPV